ncbi:hypothetical protein AVEN_164096-1 [Araneus ventricosus]|uniref:Uncharacterized protein n=1 Tax=Araneus ventricosus TaxID=182803 RepID=A0A4Y2KS80_ARAVE|nr:hypothetical protein AVEN_164096-1 [Araneus ventricosus]
MTAAAVASSTEAGDLVVHHLATTGPLPKEVRTTTGGGTKSPTIVILSGEESSCLPIGQQLIRVLAMSPGESSSNREYKLEKRDYSSVFLIWL